MISAISRDLGQRGDLNVMCCCDERFLAHTATMLVSLMENSDHAQYRVHVFLLHSGVSSRDLDQLAKMVSAYDSTLSGYSVDVARLEGLKVDKHASLANYYRLLAPEVLPESVYRVLYLDSDLLVRKPLATLWHTDLAGLVLGAVENPGFVDHDRLNLPRGLKYFNSGVMLVDLQRWRSERISQQVLEFVRNRRERVVFWDQDGLNAVVGDRWLPLDPCWNVQHAMFSEPSLRLRYADAVSDPCIVHFSGMGLKPWSAGHELPFADEYWKYRKKPPWPMGRRRMAISLWRFAQHTRRWFHSRARRCVRQMSKSDQLWAVGRRLLRVPRALLHERQMELHRRHREKEEEDLASRVLQLVPDMKVAGGPFAGMYYPEAQSFGSTLAPKLLGTYEAELAGVMEEVCLRGYRTVVNVGCAEGYYAVGLARRIEGAIIYAYDIDAGARESCAEMAARNGVASRVRIADTFDLSLLDDLDQDGHGLIICDCEGAERFVFYEPYEVSRALRSFDILIELHEFLCPGVSDYIYSKLSRTHHIVSITSVGDSVRPRVFPCPLIQGEDARTKVNLMAERRPCAMQWYWMTPKKGNAATVV